MTGLRVRIDVLMASIFVRHGCLNSVGSSGYWELGGGCRHALYLVRPINEDRQSKVGIRSEV
jgi:hypothetical protein